MTELLSCSGCGASDLHPVGPLLCCDYCGAKSVRDTSGKSSDLPSEKQAGPAEAAGTGCSTCGARPSNTRCAFCGKPSCATHSVRWPELDLHSCKPCDGLPVSQELRTLFEEWEELGRRAAPMQLELMSRQFQDTRIKKRVSRFIDGSLLVSGGLVGLVLALLWIRLTDVLKTLVVICLPLLGAFLLYGRFSSQLQTQVMGFTGLGGSAMARRAETNDVLDEIRSKRSQIRTRQAEIFEKLGW
jgi:hypothetical protein